ncbi:biotin-dependent carboxyltransferase family protein [Halocynthiibacter namhaensis]|uniref:5-oxoprolinase subunit C family protein n=1 Tax=Halocynthiibacter namhaensis TaxID=1290553 RepID=UPI0005790BE7|nr:biotin-dependent carboxyltransferase family protein [Halocynthiibacter namhaensis]
MSAIDIKFAGPLCSLQDSGRMGFLRYGVTESGPMDRQAFTILAEMLESETDFNAIEVSLGGLVIRANQTLTLGFCGGDFNLSIDGDALASWGVFTLHAGKSLTIRAGDSGSWGYLGCLGGFDARPWLGSTSSHLASGLCGGYLQAGDQLDVAQVLPREDLICALPIPSFSRFSREVRIVLGPQDGLFSDAVKQALFQDIFTVTRESDRMGMRMSGPSLAPNDALSIPSEAIIRGAVQVPGHGDPIILLADHQTTGGYPKIATVITCDQDTVGQARAGDQVQFVQVSVDDAIQATRDRAAQVKHWISEIPTHRGSLAEKLNRVNLISGVVGPDGISRH